MSQDHTAPLAGIRVLDLTRLLPGPVCTLYLADLGADVVKVEDLGPGDYARQLGNAPGTVSAFYRAVNRNKRSVAVDLKRPEGRAVLLDLARAADVVIESFRPGVMAGLRIDYPTLASINPRLVYASITGYGQTGPRDVYKRQASACSRPSAAPSGTTGRGVSATSPT